jgi:hypothetical protein
MTNSKQITMTKIPNPKPDNPEKIFYHERTKALKKP